MLVRYFGNTTRGDGNTRIRLAPDKETGAPRELVLDGDPVEVTQEEFNRLSQNFSIAVVDEDGKPVRDDSASAASPAVNQPPTTAGSSTEATSSARTAESSSSESTAGRGPTTSGK